jgi:ABC-2 type transport system permease protein
MTTIASTTSAGRVLALAVAETRLVLRNRTLLVSSLILPIGLGAFWMMTFQGQSSAAVVALQIAVAVGMGLYVAATQTLVARRQQKVLKRMRTSDLSDAGLLVAVVAPSAVVAFGQIVIFAVMDAVACIPFAVDPLAFVLAALGGLALATAAALATAVITPSAERAQITTLPLTFLLLGGAIVATFLPQEGWWPAVLAVPGAGVGALARFAAEGGMWANGLLAGLLPLAATVVWSIWLATYASKRFRWDPRR